MSPTTIEKHWSTSAGETPNDPPFTAGCPSALLALGVTSTVAVPPRPGWLDRAAEIDDLIFDQSSWFALDAGNQRIPRLVIPTRVHGLKVASDFPTVATLAGRLRCGYIAVDVDVDDRASGTSLARRVELWVAERRLWRVARPSGGAPGRHHVFVAHVDAYGNDHLAALVDFTARLRRQQGLPAKRLAVLRTVRPLSAPHRMGGYFRPTTSLAAALSTLPVERARSASERDVGATATKDLTAPRRPTARQNGESEVALTPRPRRRRELPEEWSLYVGSGIKPVIGGRDRGPSTYSLRLTHELLRAGYTSAEAWAVIADAHPEAVTHPRAASRGYTWWVKQVWNPLVVDDHGFTARGDASSQALHRQTTPAMTQPAPKRSTVGHAIARARDDLLRLQWQWGPRRRHTIRAVAEMVLDRMTRTAQTTVPVPQRDLCLDTGLSRPTVAAALRAINGSLGTLLDTFDPTDREHSSHTFQLDEKYFGLRAVGHDLPPASHAPGGGATWKLLGPLAHSIWRSLPDHTRPAASMEYIARAAGLAPAADVSPTDHQLRTTRAHLSDLAAAGLAACDVDGRWVRQELVAEDHLTAAEEAMAPVRDAISSERRVYRDAPGARWRRDRAASIEREREKARDRHRRWLHTQAPADLRARACRLASEFARLDVAEQQKLKDSLAVRRLARLGPAEAERHDAWCRSLPSVAYADRAAARATAFAHLERTEAARHIEAWRAHRLKWQVPQGHPDDLPHGASRAKPAS